MKHFITALGVIALLLCPTNIDAKKKNEKKTEVPQMANYPSAVVSEYRLHEGDVVLKSHLIWPDSIKNAMNNASEEERKNTLKQAAQMINSRGVTAYIRNYILNTEKIRVLTFNDECQIDTKIHVPYPMYVYIAPFGNIYMCPGDTVDIAMDMTKRTKDEIFQFGGTGLGSEVNRITSEINRKYLTHENYSSFTFRNASQIDSLMMWRNEQIARMDSMVIKMNEGLPELKDCSPLASDIVRTHILTWYMEMIVSSYDNYPFVKGEYDRDALWRNYFDFIAPRAKHLTDNPLLMIAADHFFFNRMEFKVFEPCTKLSHSIIHNEKGENILKSPDPKASTLVSSEEGVKIIGSPDPEALTPFRQSLARGLQKMNDELHLSKNDFSAQVTMLSEVFYQIHNGFFNKDSNLRAEALAAIMPHITNPDLARLAVLDYRDFIKENEMEAMANKPMTKGDSIFQRIIEPYKGNVLSVDFWSMSCGPCRGGMLSERETVEQLKNESVKFLYVTEDAPEECNPWLNENNIRGEHIFITRAEWALMQEKFTFSGIPFHVFVDKTGKVRTDVNDYRELMDK